MKNQKREIKEAILFTIVKKQYKISRNKPT